MKLSKNTTALVTGACGFIGSHLTERLVKMGCRVKALVGYTNSNSWGNLEELEDSILDSIEVHLGNVQDPFLLQKITKGCDVVFHLAALISIPYSYVTPAGYADTNVKGSLNVFEAALKESVRKVVHTSTSEVYGTAKYAPIDEAHPLQAQSPYAATKIAADKLAESYFHSFQLPVATIRPFNTYGPRQSSRAVIPSVISQILSGTSQIKLGLLTPVRDFNFVQDTVNGFVAIAESEKSNGQVINIGSGRGVTIGETVDLIKKIMKSDVKVICDEERVRPAASEVFKLICNNQKAKELTGWESQFSLEDGLRQTIDYIERNLDRYRVESYCK